LSQEAAEQSVSIKPHSKPGSLNYGSRKKTMQKINEENLVRAAFYLGDAVEDTERSAANLHKV